MRNDTKMIIHINLPKNFVEVVHNEMEQELTESSKKWEVSLNQSQRENILRHAINQTKQKVSDNAKNQWDLSDRLTIKANSTKKGIEIVLPDPNGNVPPNVKLFYTRDGWELDQEHHDEAVALVDFADYIQNKIKTWVRTAVFYGVASYTQ